MRLLLIPVAYFALTGLLWFLVGDRIELPHSFGEVVPWLRSFERWAWAVAMGIVIVDFLLPMPASAALIALGVIYGPWIGGILGGASVTAAGVLGFAFTRTLGRRGALYLATEAELARVERFYERWGAYAVVLGRAVGGPAEWLVLTAGISEMPFSKAFAGVAIGGFTAAFVHALLGDLAVEQPLLAVGGVVALALLVTVAVRSMLRSTPRP